MWVRTMRVLLYDWLSDTQIAGATSREPIDAEGGTGHSVQTILSEEMT
jgi:hypothetical protein